MIRQTISTPDGPFVLCFSSKGLAAVHFPGNDRPEQPARDTVGARPPAEWLAQSRDAILDTLNGRSPRTMPPLDLGAGTAFQRSVWEVLRRIPSGHTLSYGEVARELGKPGAVRAVGQACGANPIPLLVPCHRVLAANRRIGGFSGGLEWKRKLLERERISIEEPVTMRPR